MPGFIDVTNMTDEQVKRLGQQDEPDMPANRRGRYVRPAPVMIDATQLFIAAAAAHRINGGEYIKASTYQHDSTKPANRTIMESVLKGETPTTEDDAEMVEGIRTHFRGLTLQILAGKMLGEYQAKALSLCNLNEIDSREINVVASLPSVFAREQKRKSVDDRLYECEASYLGPVGGKMTFRADILRQIYSQNYGCYFITAVSESNHSLFWASRKEFQVGSTLLLEGKIKGHRAQYQTQLNYVKVLG